jgi:hypothetical protein
VTTASRRTRRPSPWLLAGPIAALVVAVVVVAVRAGSGGGSAAPVPSPTTTPPSGSASAADRLAAAFDAAHNAGSVHLDLVQRGGGRTLRFSDDDGADNGVQRITLTPDLRVEVRVVGSATYVRANAPGLVAQFQLPRTLAARAQNEWLLLRPGDPFYGATTEGVTLDSTLAEYGLSGRLTLLPERTIDGTAVVGIRGTASVIPRPSGKAPTATLWIRADGAPLPVAYESKLGRAATMRVTFSHWGAPVQAPAPAHATRLTELAASASA